MAENVNNQAWIENAWKLVRLLGQQQEKSEGQSIYSYGLNAEFVTCAMRHLKQICKGWMGVIPSQSLPNVFSLQYQCSFIYI